MDDIKTISRSSYPENLKNMKSPPEQLYIRGGLIESPDQRYLCVVGSRRATDYGKDAVNKIVSGLKGYPISIVSGLAYGIDSMSHVAALEAGLHCVAFPGSSLAWAEIYPNDHVDLARRIVASGGALMSLWEPGHPMGRWAFPARNALMAGLSQATLVVEAGRKSGSLMTAKHAEQFDRDVLAVPGSVNAAFSYGPHMLIRSGAALIRSSEDVLEELGFQIPRRGRKTRDAAFKYKLERLDPLSAAIMDILSREEVSMDRLAQSLNVRPNELNWKISLLELEGLIKTGGGFARIA
jgi:DNA processing protein